MEKGVGRRPSGRGENLGSRQGLGGARAVGRGASWPQPFPAAVIPR